VIERPLLADFCVRKGELFGPTTVRSLPGEKRLSINAWCLKLAPDHHEPCAEKKPSISSSSGQSYL